jgi:membrane-bound ClpP family serine protease
MDLGAWAILLLMVGLLLIVVEVFLPTGGIVGIFAAVCLVMSVACAWWAWWASPMLFLGFLTSLGVLIPVVVMAAFHFLPLVPFANKAILPGPRPEDVVPFQAEEKHLRELIGQIGETETVLNPAGMVRLENERLHCQSEGMILEAGTAVRVVAVKGNRLVVRLHSRAADASRPARPVKPTAIDFDLG